MSCTSRSRLLLPALPVALVGGILAGCDRADSDRAEREKLNRAYALRAVADGQNTHVTLANEVAASQSGDATMAMAHELVGDVSVDQAAAVMAGLGREPEPGLGALQTSAIILAEQANRLATALVLSRASIQTEQQRDPQTVLQSVEQRLGSVETGEGWQPGPNVDGQLPALESIQQRIEELDTRLADLNGQINQLEQQQADLLTQASAFDEQSDQQQGFESVETFRKAADLRTQAAEVSASAQQLRAQVRYASADLEQAQSLRQSLEQTIAALRQERDAINQKWANVQEQIGRIGESAQATFASAEMDEARGNPQSSLELMGRRLGPTLAAMAEQRNQAVSLLTKAADSYQSASSRAAAATSQRNELFRTAYGHAFNTRRLSLSRANALRQLGSVQAASAGAFAALFQLQQTLKEADRDLPEAVQQAIPQAADGTDTEASNAATRAYVEAIDAAARAYVEANEILAGVSSGSGPIDQAALTQRAAVIAGIWGLQSLIETTGVPVTAEMPPRAELASTARELAAAAQAVNAPIPAVAPFVGAADAPTTGPATDQAVPEAEGAGEPEQPGEGGAEADGEGEAAEGDAAGQP